ncbi:Protein of unknown function DUF284,transmembrane eukaryotic family-containing protein [Strongyloides ratti]|uniref:Cell cycle control protein 50A n=1 Tax=Strongyloides ratti TaxID=34506 RepID=A0A090KUA3_STRRB|nr:Protein of unknown function DUF284,transmembrane eukaryotic family-containing protein [Strongyloides ratti]CEF61085.1 Protein of unknown function DUF284,transmembrane eukaryotic family-containing protein [Strongyloides ratti]
MIIKKDFDDKNNISKIPKDSPIRQQKLKAWQPIPTLYTVIPFTFFIGIIFIPLGGILLKESINIKELIIDYTDCFNNLICEKKFFLEDDFNGDVYFFYQLGSNIYDVSGCDSYSRENENDPNSKVIYPCGAIANSMFNDKFELVYKYREQPNPLWPSYDITVPWTYKGLLIEGDRVRLFKNPHYASTSSLCEALSNTVRPKKWNVDVCMLDVTNSQNNGVQNFDFIIWMTTAGFNNFRKPYRKLLRTIPQLSSGLPRGEYVLKVTNNYDVLSFNGTKQFVISTTSWIGGKNPFFGIAFLTVAGICIFFGSVLLIIHYKFGHSLEEIGNLDNM